MRRFGLIGALFPAVRGQILSALYLSPDREWYLSDLARHIGTRPSSLQRELAALTGAGLVVRTCNGNRAYHRANRECPVFSELRSLFVKTSGLAEEIRQALAGVGAGIRSAFIFGSVAAGTDRPSSDVDVMIIGVAALADVAAVLRPLEERLSRQVNASLCTEAEYRRGIETGRHFLAGVHAGPKLFIIGGEDGLEAIAERGASGVAHDEQE
jgi:predicted nucleotidyltransferase